MMEPNPPWADRILSDNWGRIENKIGRSLMPLPKPSTSKRDTYTEYGCGSYGCVYPTATRGKVFKITTDATEAVFISSFLQIDENDRPNGIVHYDGVWEISGAKYGKRSIFVLTREEAYDVGSLSKSAFYSDKSIAKFREIKRFLDRLFNFKQYAHIIRERMNRSKNVNQFIDDMNKYSGWAEEYVDYGKIMQRFNDDIPGRLVGARASAYAVRACKIVAETMAGEDIGYLVGETLFSLMEYGLLLADVHANNIGQVDRGPRGDGLWVITDPGHLVPLSTKWLDVQVETL